MTPVELAAGISGTISFPGDDTWDTARLFHAGIGSPDLVVRAATVGDVQAAVSYAASADLPIGVRGGGHSVWGTLPGGVVMDLGGLSDIAVDPDTRRVSVGGGATWGEVSADAHPELFWALRGGGGNFGVVTRFDFEAHPLSAVVFTTLRVDVDRPAVAPAVLRTLRDTMRDAPRELTVT